MIVRKAFVVTLGAFALIASAAATTSLRAASPPELHPPVPADHPIGAGATVTLVSSKRLAGSENISLSTYLIDYPPGASAELHRMPSSGYVLTHVLSGAIQASAWQAGVGIYRAGDTWVEPAFAYRIATTNTSRRDSARALVVLVTRQQEPSSTNVTTVAEQER
ncbi:hypothetical protein I6F35_15505 [Bradyrhizobium sp. BRP22]|uniref:hypothetical protein n=1 Tax=Bradyrhizobium sp. BRP22 TaxID=2793821 RepID=UPI001CD7A08D|nr:hypothetical protein [Bradyrhizobium sp. BRP22]MCA1454616.1 hypothetical protein [Bradyrhizobium sp. BRP22]